MAQPKCMLCGESESILIQRGVRYSSDTEVRQCTNCTLVFLSPIPTDDTLRDYYGDHYRTEFGSPPSEARFHNKLPDALVRMGRIQPLLGRDKRLLEVGSDVGSFLTLVRPYVANVAGVEMDNGARDWSRRSGMTVAERLSEVSGTYDIVAMFHVLEHIPDPHDFLVALHQHMDRNGRLVLEIPNVEDALITVYNVPAYQKFYYQRPHLYYFSAVTIRGLLEKSGYRVETLQGIQRYDLSNHIHWMLSGEPGGKGKYAHVLGEIAGTAYQNEFRHSVTLKSPSIRHP